eukprot:PhM_4_TR11532/c0_g1_i1/m.36906
MTDVAVSSTTRVVTLKESRTCRWCSQTTTFEHEEKCALRDVDCQACGMVVKAKTYASHVKECHVLYTQCEQCSGVLLKVHLEDHRPRCAYRRVVCRRCRSEMFAVEYTDHKLDGSCKKDRA